MDVMLTISPVSEHHGADNYWPFEEPPIIVIFNMQEKYKLKGNCVISQRTRSHLLLCPHYLASLSRNTAQPTPFPPLESRFGRRRGHLHAVAAPSHVVQIITRLSRRSALLAFSPGLSRATSYQFQECFHNSTRRCKNTPLSRCALFIWRTISYKSVVNTAVSYGSASRSRDPIHRPAL